MKQDIYNIPEGYKNSPLGIIPNEWEVERLGNIVSITSGESPSLYTLTSHGKYPFIKVEDMNNCEKYQIRSREYSNDEKNIIHKESIIFPKRGAAILNNKVRIAKVDIQMDSNMMAIKPNNKVLPEYLFYSITFEQLFRIADTSTIPQINNKHINPYKILLPPLNEQRKIAEVLSTWDKAIEKQTLLVEKLELRKKGLMQQLLTGKKRLHGFSEEWKTVKLGSIADVVGGGTPDTNNSDYWDGNIAWLTPSEIGTEKYVYTSKKHITEEGLKNSSARLLPVGTIVFTSRATIGLKAILKTEASTNQGFQSLIISQSSNIEFVYYLLDILIHVIRKKSSGSTFPEISANSLKSINITTPPLEEQNAIAEILSVCDNEITLAKQKLDTLRQQKKGLMQVLLTGKKRVEL